MRRLLKRWWWALLALLVALGFWRIRFDLEVLNLLPPDEPTVQGLKLYQEHFANARELIVSLRAPTAEAAEGLAGAIAARLRQETNLVARAVWQPPWMEQPAQMAEILAVLWLNQPPETFGALTNRLAPDNLPAVLAESREALATSLSPTDLARRAFDPYDLLSFPGLANVSGFSADQGRQMFASADGTFRLVYVEARPDLAGYRECASWLASIQAIVAGLRTNALTSPADRAPAGSPADDSATSLSPEDTAKAVIRYTGRPVFVTEIANSMRGDLTGSVTGTAVIIALLFWIAHRRWLPMLWLLTLLGLILAATLGLGGLLLGSINVISLGFAAVLLGLAVDYAVVHYQEALAHPQLSVPEIRRAIAPSILWAAITTISAFLVLNLGGLPGLGQLGSLVGLGVALAALVMVMVYLPPLFPGRRRPGPGFRPQPWWTFFRAPRESDAAARPQPDPANSGVSGEGAAEAGQRSPRPKRWLWLTAVLVAFTGAITIFHPPRLDRTANALRLEHSEAQAALAEVTAAMDLPEDPVWLIVPGQNEQQVHRRLLRAESLLDSAVSNRVVNGYLLPTALWPNPEAQAANRPAARVLASRGPLLRHAALEAGYNTNALFLTDEMTRIWGQAGAASGVLWPTNPVSQWLLSRFVARSTNQWLVLGLVYPGTNQVARANALPGLAATMAQDGLLLSGWGLLGSSTLERVRGKFWQLVVPMVVLVLASLWFAFRRASEILLGLAVLLLSGLCLLATMSLAGWSWNLLNLMAVPLILGTGVDYGLFMQLGLRRLGGDARAVRRSIGRALLLCGGTAIAGFGALGLSSNAGMASLGRVCAVGIGANMLIAVFLLPSWWAARTKGPNFRPEVPGDGTEAQSPVAGPSAFYRRWLWRVGLGAVRILPRFILEPACLLLAEAYYRLGRARREVVIQNLLPAVEGRRIEAEQTAHRLYRQFALKLLDLWRFESGIPVDSWFTAGVDWAILEAACKRGKGVLLVTPHLGNWELGGPLLSRLDVPLLVLTQAEPGAGFTELRIASRKRWGIETLVVGSGGFDFVEVIKRLQAGAAVALLIDRPPAQKAVEVELFGRLFRASIAAAELARAAGCALLGVTVVRRGQGYAARILPEFQYDRAALGNRDARHELTRQILRAFEPDIRRDLDQWFHFVPVWPPGADAEERNR